MFWKRSLGFSLCQQGSGKKGGRKGAWSSEEEAAAVQGSLGKGGGL